jgi:hypothetical protein
VGDLPLSFFFVYGLTELKWFFSRQTIEDILGYLIRKWQFLTEFVLLTLLQQYGPKCQVIVSNHARGVGIPSCSDV